MATPSTRRRWLRFSLRTLLVLVTIAAVASWGYWMGWPWWVIQREQQRFLATVTQIKCGMTAMQLSQIDSGSHSALLRLGGTPADRPEIIMDSYAWKDRNYCVLYECGGRFGPTNQPLTRIEVYQLDPMPPNYQPLNTRSFSQSFWRLLQSSSGVPRGESWVSKKGLNYPRDMSSYFSDFASFILSDRKNNSGFQYELIYSDPPKDKSH